MVVWWVGNFGFGFMGGVAGFLSGCFVWVFGLGGLVVWLCLIGCGGGELGLGC